MRRTSGADDASVSRSTRADESGSGLPGPFSFDLQAPGVVSLKASLYETETESILSMKPRELDAAKRRPQSKARQRILELGMDASAGLLLVLLGELEKPSDEEYAEAVDAIKLMATILGAE